LTAVESLDECECVKQLDGNHRDDELRQLLDAWTSGLSMRSTETARSYRMTVSSFLTATRGNVGDVHDAVAYVKSLDGYAPATRAHHISAVRSFLRFARAQGAVEASVDSVLVRPRVSVTSYGRYLTADEARTLVTAAQNRSIRHLAAVLALVLTGLRVSELAGARWRDLYLDPQGRLGLRIIGKGGSERVVKVRDDLFSVLTSLHGSYQLDARDATPLIPNCSGGPYAARGLHNLVAQAVKDSGIRKPVSPHWLRHTHAVLAAAGGSSALVIQESLGHSRLETSQRYIHWARGLAETTVDALPALT
jgi:integrase/recombinase XerD